MAKIGKKYSVFAGLVRTLVFSWQALLALRGNLFEWLRSALVFFGSYLAQAKNSNFRKSIRFWYPILNERIYYSRLDPVYFYQDAWCAQKVFRATPESHVDIASNLKLVSILAQFTPITFIDINQPHLIIPNVQYKMKKAIFAACRLKTTLLIL